MSENDNYSATAEDIMTPYVIKLGLDGKFKDVVELMSEKKISAVFIEDAPNKQYFIITKTDVIDFLKNGAISNQNLPDISVREFMVGPIETIDYETSIDNVIRYMTEHNYKRVLISKGGEAAGVVSTRDIMKWNNTYFKPAKPQILLFMDNINSTFVAKEIFEENIDDEVKDELIDLYGGALTSISAITDEIINKSGEMRQLLKDKRSILFEPYQGITGVLVSDYNSIELRQKLKQATKKFYEQYKNIIENSHAQHKGLNVSLDIDPAIPIFKKSETKKK